jgi:integrase/recombinase XerD
MIATPSLPKTCEFKSKFGSSPDPDSVAKQSDQPKRVTHHDPKSNADTDSESANQNLKQIDRCLKRLADSNLWGIEHVSAYLRDQHRRGCRPSTLRSSSAAIYQFLNYLKALGRTCLDAVVRDDLASFVEHEQDRGIKPNTVAARLRWLYAFLGYLAERQVVHPDLLKKKMRIKLPDTLPRAIDPQDMSELLSVIDHVRNKAMILLLLRTGMRIGELLGLKLCDVNLRERRIEIFEARKTRVGRVVYISDDARKALTKWLKERCVDKKNLFYAQGRNTMGYESARAMFKKYLDKAGLSHKDYTLHCLRHTFASELLNAGMRLECVQQLLGHSSIEMTRRYARLTDNTRKEEYFNAMAIIEKGGINGHYRIDFELPQTLEA